MIGLTTSQVTRTGRTPLHERKTLTDLENSYCAYRSSGMTVAQASKKLNMPKKEMLRREQVHPLIKDEIARLRGEKQTLDVQESHRIRKAILNNLYDDTRDKIESGKLTIPETQKAYNILQSIESDLADIELSQGEPVIKSESGGEFDFHKFLAAMKKQRFHKPLPENVEKMFYNLKPNQQVKTLQILWNHLYGPLRPEEEHKAKVPRPPKGGIHRSIH